jgi:hypothetical protein
MKTSGDFYVTRLDGEDMPGGNRQEAEYFVLDIVYDPYAKEALSAYAAALVRDGTRPDLVNRLFDEFPYLILEEAL